MEAQDSATALGHALATIRDAPAQGISPDMTVDELVDALFNGDFSSGDKNKWKDRCEAAAELGAEKTRGRSMG